MKINLSVYQSWLSLFNWIISREDESFNYTTVFHFNNNNSNRNSHQSQKWFKYAFNLNWMPFWDICKTLRLIYKFYALNHFHDRWTDFSVSVNANECVLVDEKECKKNDEQIKPTEMEEKRKKKKKSRCMHRNIYIILFNQLLYSNNNKKRVNYNLYVYRFFLSFLLEFNLPRNNRTKPGENNSFIMVHTKTVFIC